LVRLRRIDGAGGDKKRIIRAATVEEGRSRRKASEHAVLIA